MGVDAPQATTGDVAAEERYNACPGDIAEDDGSTQEVDGQEAPMNLQPKPLGPYCRAERKT